MLQIYPKVKDEVFVILKVKNLTQWTYVIADFNCEELLGTFQNNKLQETKNGSIHYKNGSKFS